MIGEPVTFCHIRKKKDREVNLGLERERGLGATEIPEKALDWIYG